MMRQEMAMIVIFSLMFTFVTVRVDGNPLPSPVSGCRPSLRSVDTAANCVYGVTRDACNNVVCLKGPSEMCGGKYGR